MTQQHRAYRYFIQSHSATDNLAFAVAGFFFLSKMLSSASATTLTICSFITQTTPASNFEIYQLLVLEASMVFMFLPEMTSLATSDRLQVALLRPFSGMLIGKFLDNHSTDFRKVTGFGKDDSITFLLLFSMPLDRNVCSWMRINGHGDLDLPSSSSTHNINE